VQPFTFRELRAIQVHDSSPSHYSPSLTPHLLQPTVVWPQHFPTTSLPHPLRVASRAPPLPPSPSLVTSSPSWLCVDGHSHQLGTVSFFERSCFPGAPLSTARRRVLSPFPCSWEWCTLASSSFLVAIGSRCFRCDSAEACVSWQFSHIILRCCVARSEVAFASTWIHPHSRCDPPPCSLAPHQPSSMVATAYVFSS
jgi:hypothetical protein